MFEFNKGTMEQTRNINKWILLLLVLFAQNAIAAIVDTFETYSPTMKKNIKAIVIRPDNYSELKEKLPVVYLLHGYGGNYADWITKAKGFEKASDLYQMMIVCPDGEIASWYWDSPVDPKCQYETYVSKELVKWIDHKYKTIVNSKGRAITGLSMGGHGALYLAFKHQNIFGAAGSMSGGVDIRPFPNSWDMVKRLGSYSEQPERWEKNTVINMLYLINHGSLSLIFDCGSEDFFIKVNENLHQQILMRNIPHDFTSRPDIHNWTYWENAIGYQLLFMNNYFKN